MPGAIPKPFPSHLLGPRHWGAWLGLGMAKLIAMLPYPAQMWLGRRLGALTVRWGSSRRKVADRNLALCFPDLPPDQHAALLEANLRDMGLMAVEFALGWMTPRRAWPRVQPGSKAWSIFRPPWRPVGEPSWSVATFPIWKLPLA